MSSSGVFVVGVYLIHAGEHAGGGLVASTRLTGRAMAPLAQIAGILTRFHQARNSLKALDVLMRTPVERPEGRGFVHRPSFSGHIEFKNVNFTYPGQKALALDDVSFKIAAGEKRSEEHTSELQSLMRNSYAVFCLKKKQKTT